MLTSSNRQTLNLLLTGIYTSNNSSVLPHPSPAVPVRYDSEQQQLTKIPPLHQSFPFHPWICKCVWCAINRSTKQMHGNESSTSLVNICTFPSAYQACCCSSLWVPNFCNCFHCPDKSAAGFCRFQRVAFHWMASSLGVQTLTAAWHTFNFWGADNLRCIHSLQSSD